MYGPKGIGFLYVRTGVVLTPLEPGGGQEAGLRGGTEHVAACIGLATALELSQDKRGDELRRLGGLESELGEAIASIPGVRRNGSAQSHYPGIMNFTIDDVRGEDLVAHLDAVGFGVATGSACTAGDEDPSHVLLAIGLSKAEAEASLRVSFGRPTSTSDIQKFAAALGKVVERLRNLG